MPLSAGSLYDFLREVERALERPVTLVAAGGTALTLLKVKESTLDVDFTGPKDDVKAFRAALGRTPHGFKVDLWPDGQVFSQFLPEDYLTRSRQIRRFGRISLKALHPVDIVVTKAGRLDARDEEDIRDCIRHFGLKKHDIAARAKQVEYVGREETYLENVDDLLRRHFS